MAVTQRQSAGYGSILPPLAATIGFVVLVMYRSAHPVVEYPDFWYFVQRAQLQRLPADVLSTTLAAFPFMLREWVEPWANGFWPLGYPALLSIVNGVLGDPAGAARVISACSAFLYAILAGVLALRVAGRRLAALVFALTLSHPSLLWPAQVESTDMLSAMLQMAAVVVIWSAERTSRKAAVTAGCLCGLAYLARYQAIVMLPFLAVLMLWKGGNSRQKLILMCLVGAGFVLGAGPQLLQSWKASGNPFFSLQWRNVWFAINNGQGWWSWREMPLDGSLAGVAMSNPFAFVRQYLAELARAPFIMIWAALGVFVCLVSAAIAGSESRQGTAVPRFAVFAGSVSAQMAPVLRFGMLAFLGTCLAMSIGFIDDRVTLPVLWVQTFVMALGVMWLDGVCRARLHGRWRYVAAPAVALVLVLAGVCVHYTVLANRRARHETTLSVSAVLRRDGLASARQAISTGFTLYDIDSQERYDSVIWYLPSTPVDAHDLARMACAAGYTWLILDDTYGAGMFPWLRNVLDGPPQGAHVVADRQGRTKVVIVPLGAAGCSASP